MAKSHSRNMAAINEEITLNMPEKDDTVKYNYVDTYAYYCATEGAHGE